MRWSDSRSRASRAAANASKRRLSSSSPFSSRSRNSTVLRAQRLVRELLEVGLERRDVGGLLLQPLEPPPFAEAQCLFEAADRRGHCATGYRVGLRPSPARRVAHAARTDPSPAAHRTSLGSARATQTGHRVVAPWPSSAGSPPARRAPIAAGHRRPALTVAPWTSPTDRSQERSAGPARPARAPCCGCRVSGSAGSSAYPARARRRAPAAVSAPSRSAPARRVPLVRGRQHARVAPVDRDQHCAPAPASSHRIRRCGFAVADPARERRRGRNPVRRRPRRGRAREQRPARSRGTPLRTSSRWTSTRGCSRRRSWTGPSSRSRPSLRRSARLVYADRCTRRVPITAAS